MRGFGRMMKKGSAEWKRESENDNLPPPTSDPNNIESPATATSTSTTPSYFPSEIPERRLEEIPMHPLGSGGLSGNGMSQMIHKGSSGSGSGSGAGKKNTLPLLLFYIETGNYQRAQERAMRHKREVKTWATIPIQASSRSAAGGADESESVKRLALHHACLKLRAASASMVKCYNSRTIEGDPFVELCRLILTLIEVNPSACGERETRHGCMPLHLVAFASCAGPSAGSKETASAAVGDDDYFAAAQQSLSPTTSTFSTASMSSALPSFGSDTDGGGSATKLSRPHPIIQNQRSLSEATTDTLRTTMSVAIAEENFTGIQSDYQNERNLQQGESESQQRQQQQQQQQQQVQSVCMGNNIFVSAEREEWAVRVINALLDNFPRAVKMTSEGSRLPLHWAAAGRATPRVVSTLIRAYPDAAKHRTKDGSLPLHLCAHWGISHSDVAVSMLRSYPDATYGKNRWERSPLEEALCMAGENGRPHQAVLVRSLRKHHSYWTRPEGVLFQQPRRSPGDKRRNIVDIDETVDSMDDSDEFGNEEEDNLFRDDRGVFGKPRANDGTNMDAAKRYDLPTLIRFQKWELVAQRLESNPNEARLNLRVPTRGGFTSTTGFTPLHMACENIPPKEILQKLIKLSPSAVGLKFMPGGKLPLHVACTWHAPKESIDLLLATDRNVCKVPDELGNLPIHLACFSGAPSIVIEHLLKAYPKAVLFRNAQGSLAEDIARRLKHNNRNSTLTLLNLCRDEVNKKRQMKHRRNRSDGVIPSTLHEKISAERCVCCGSIPLHNFIFQYRMLRRSNFFRF
mmetsp:Transcript_26747/g.73586  ORF Transcript_26747/g.73586 Transcript_26747/m.73586 type:complete len:800 (-) Transcript_26747:1019-3418(-)